MKEWLKRNWLSVVAIILSIVALCRCEPFVFTESALNWVLGLVVAIMGIAVSVALVTQIWTAVKISPMIDDKIKELKEEMLLSSRFMRMENKYQLMAHDAIELALKALEKGEFNSYIHLSIAAIDTYCRSNDNLNCQYETENLINCIENCKANNPNIGLHPKDVEVFVEMIDKINFPLSKLVRKILSLPTNENYPSLEH